MEKNEGKIDCILDGQHGIYIPQLFAKLYPEFVNGEDKEILIAGPEHEQYWDAWDDVLNYAEWKDDEGNKWTLYQNDDLFAVREDFEWEDWL